MKAQQARATRGLAIDLGICAASVFATEWAQLLNAVLYWAPFVSAVRICIAKPDNIAPRKVPTVPPRRTTAMTPVRSETVQSFFPIPRERSIAVRFFCLPMKRLQKKSRMRMVIRKPVINMARAICLIWVKPSLICV